MINLSDIYLYQPKLVIYENNTYNSGHTLVDRQTNGLALNNIEISHGGCG